MTDAHSKGPDQVYTFPCWPNIIVILFAALVVLVLIIMVILVIFLVLEVPRMILMVIFLVLVLEVLRMMLMVILVSLLTDDWSAHPEIRHVTPHTLHML